MMNTKAFYLIHFAAWMARVVNPPNPLLQGGAGAYSQLSYFIQKKILGIEKAGQGFIYNRFFSQYYWYGLLNLISPIVGFKEELNPSHSLMRAAIGAYSQLSYFIQSKVLAIQRTGQGLISNPYFSQYYGSGLHNLFSPLEKGGRGIDYGFSSLYQNSIFKA